MSIDDWFMLHILPFEGQLTQFLRENWRGESSVNDIRAEIYARVYKAAKITRPDQPRVLLMATARHMVFDEIRKANVIDLGALRAANTGRDLLDTENTVVFASPSQEDALFRTFLEGLTKQERQVFLSFTAHGYSLGEIAKRFGLSEQRASKLIAKLLGAWADVSHSTTTSLNDNAANKVAGRTTVG